MSVTEPSDAVKQKWLYRPRDVDLSEAQVDVPQLDLWLVVWVDGSSLELSSASIV